MASHAYKLLSVLKSQGNRLGWFTAGATTLFVGSGIVFDKNPLFWALAAKTTPITFDTSFVLDPEQKQALKNQLKQHQSQYVEKGDICQLVTTIPSEKGEYFKFDINGKILSHKRLPFKGL